MAKEPVRITIQGVLSDLESGYTRTTVDKNYQGDKKSIEEKYGLNKTQVSQLFKHEKLKGRKTIVTPAPAFILVDEDEEEQEDSPNITDTKDIKDTNDPTDSDEGVTTDDGGDSDLDKEKEKSPNWM
jgi:hypothetical protein